MGIGSILGLFGGKFGLYASIGAALLIAGMFGYIKYTGAVHARTEIELRDKLSTARRDIADRDAAISTMKEEQALFGSKVQDIADAMEGLQAQISRNTQTRRNDYTKMTSPKPISGTPTNLDAVQDQANNGMNGLFNDLTNISQPAPGATK
jgi:hypothetical protein